MGAVIEVEGLVRKFGAVTAVDGVEFRVEEGEVFGFLGPNGAGKTTTVRMLTGVIDPTAGTARIHDHDIRAEPLLSRAHMGIVPEEANVYVDLSVWQNVMLMAELHGVPRRQRTEDGQRLLDGLGLADRKKQKARELSKGLRQRLMLCTALVTRPEVLFLDEPTGGLDVQSARIMREIVRERNREGLTVFLTTHNMAEAEAMCSRVAIINKGRIAATDTPAGLLSLLRSRQYVEARFAGKQPAQEGLAALPGVSEVRQDEDGWRLYAPTPGPVAAQAAKLADEQGLVLEHLCTRQPSLEDIFVHLTSGKAEDN